ncbi:hypothetical protein K1W69_01185 [Hoeflea sp. WL0058]|uniref:Uncharacterized protein n=1 Tax=Flavimaribacter sediminis TaxID=2865987 RepID=A0AAE3CYL8_9HYPH|nr:hypothetical protein [Flavimaribacter sediminis]MBW8635784.1 hypothetical protein [Flavimaribacter sediminis]
MTETDKSRLSSCGNPCIEKEDGDEVVQAYIAAMPPKASKVCDARYWKIHDYDDFDVEQLADRVRQSLKLAGHKLT